MMSEDEEQQVSAAGYLMSEDNLARRVKYEMEQRGWSQERMAKEMTDAGFPIHQTSIGKIVSPGRGKRRAVSVDDAIGFAKVFGLSVQDLLIPVESVLDERLRPMLDQMLTLVKQRTDIQEELMGMTREMVQISQQLDWEHIEQISGPKNTERLAVFLSELARWGNEVMRQAESSALDALTEEEKLDKLRHILFGDPS